jgi:hypothetical protein
MFYLDHQINHQMIVGFDWTSQDNIRLEKHLSHCQKTTFKTALDGIKQGEGGRPFRQRSPQSLSKALQNSPFIGAFLWPSDHQ